MEKNQLDSRLKELHRELQQIKSVDEDERQLLKNLLGDIEKLTQSGESDQHHNYERLGEGLRQGMELFEASHPRATMLMGQVADALAKIGI